MPGRGSDLANAINKAEALLKKRPHNGVPGRRKWGRELAQFVKAIARSPMSDEQLFTHIQSPALWECVQSERTHNNLKRVMG